MNFLIVVHNNLQSTLSIFEYICVCCICEPWCAYLQIMGPLKSHSVCLEFKTVSVFVAAF